ncbi:MAG: DUF21 domain-containing protein [Planctomycetes bacterium]|nr:DUF21 domain-containing protein [Planctomycetota bacterium]
MTALILYFALALGASFVCSLLEAITLSLTDSYIAALQTKQPRSSALLKQIMDRIDRALSAILTLNTIANTIGAMGVGAQVVRLWGNAYLGVVSGVFTLMILVFSEIIPKTLGAVYWRKLAPGAAYWICGLTWLLKYPIAVLEVISNLVVGKSRRPRFYRDEIVASVRIGHKEGALRDSENRVIQNMLRLQSIRIKDILTPRSVVLAFPRHESIADVVKEHSPLHFSRIPIYGKDLDDITGVVHRYSLLQSLSGGKGYQALQSIVLPIHAVPDTQSVTCAIETLLGVEIIDELDKVEDMRKWAVQLWEKRKQERRL